MTLVEHLEELRTRIIRGAIGLAVGMAIALAFGQHIFALLNQPLFEVAGKDVLITTDMTDPFLMYMKISLYVGLMISSPWVFYQIWMFISAGLYPHERRYVTWAVPFCTTLFLSGAAFFLFFISKALLKFFVYWNTVVMRVKLNITLPNHISMMTNMMLVFGLCFQMPVAVLLLSKMGLVTMKTLRKYRKHVIVVILIVAAFCTSPSPLDQIALAIPMWLLYELGILLSYFLVEKPRRKEEEAEAALEAAERAAAGGGDDGDEEDDEYEYEDEHGEAYEDAYGGVEDPDRARQLEYEPVEDAPAADGAAEPEAPPADPEPTDRAGQDEGEPAADSDDSPVPPEDDEPSRPPGGRA